MMDSVNVKASAPGPIPEATVWCLSWQAAVGREFFSAKAKPALVDRIRRRLIGAHDLPGRVLIDYVLLPTEIHIITRLDAGDSVSGIARAFGNVLARWVREEQPIRSPVLAGPYWSRNLLSREELLAEMLMLAWRPVVLGLRASPTHYRLGAVRIATGLSPGNGFNAGPFLKCFEPAVPLARLALKRWIRHRPTEEAWRAWELSRGLRLATSNDGRHRPGNAASSAAAALIAAGGSYEVKGALMRLETWVAAKIGLANSPDLGSSAGAQAVRGRALVAGLAVTHHLCSAAAVARHFGRAKATLSEQMAASRRRSEDRQILDTPLATLLSEIVSR